MNNPRAVYKSLGSTFVSQRFNSLQLAIVLRKPHTHKFPAIATLCGLLWGVENGSTYSDWAWNLNLRRSYSACTRGGLRPLLDYLKRLSNTVFNTHFNLNNLARLGIGEYVKGKSRGMRRNLIRSPHTNHVNQ